MNHFHKTVTLPWILAAASVLPTQAKPSPDKMMADALISGNEDKAMQVLEKGAPVEGHDRFGTTRLMEAAHRGQARVVAALLDKGASVNAVNRFGENALLQSMVRGGDVAIASLLIQHGADVNHAGKNGVIPLFLAAGGNRADLIERLVAAGASPDATNQDRYRVTPLGFAACYAQIDAVHALIAAGATVDKPDAQGGTPLAGAVAYDHAEVAAALLRAGANPNQTLANGKPLVVACISQHRSKVLAALVAAKADVNLVYMNMTPLMWAVGLDVNCLPILLAAKPDLEQKVKRYFIANVMLPPGATPPKNYHERTALMEAVEGKRTDAVKMLLEAGADPSTRDDSGSTAVDLARRSGYDEGVHLLEATPNHPIAH